MNQKKRTLHLFGGGTLLVEAAKVGIHQKILVVVHTSKRLVKNNKWVQEIKKLRIPIREKNSVKPSEKEPKINAGDIGISFGAPWIFKKEWIRQWHGNLFNCHNRPLPKHRGAGGATWLILMQEKIGASTIHKIDEGVDTGPIVFQKFYKIPKNLNKPKSLDLFTEIKGKKFIQDSLPKIIKANFPNQKQNNKKSTYWPRLATPVHGWINWSWSAQDIKTFCYAFGEPYEGAKSFFNKNLLYVHEIRIIKEKNQKFHPFQTGLIFRKAKDESLYIAHPEGIIHVKKWSTKTNKNPKEGDRIFTPHKYLERSFSYKVQYSPDGIRKKL